MTQWRASIRFAPAATLPCVALAVYASISDGLDLDGFWAWVLALGAVALLSRGIEITLDVITRRMLDGANRTILTGMAVATAAGAALHTVLLLILPAVYDRIHVAGPGTAITGGILLGVFFGIGLFLEEVEFFVEKGAGTGS